MLEFESIRYNPDESMDQYAMRLRRKLLQAMPNLNDDAMQGPRDLLLRDKFLKGLPEPYQLHLQQIPNLTYEGLQLHAQQMKAAEDYRVNKSLPLTTILNGKSRSIGTRRSTLRN